MLTTATKRKIDTARDILVGKIPVPTAQVEQITLALIYKFMSDMDEQARKLGDTTGFFANGYEKYAWDKLMDKALPARDRVLLYRDALEKMSLNPHIPQLFRDVFKNASLPFNDPETLKLFLDVIDQFEYDHSEELGNAFEYLLQVMGSQGDAGQFRTPRHIIDFIIEVVNPKKTDKILDPACGTAGFLISAYKHLQKQGLSTDEMTQVSENVVGYDISQDMQRLSLVNMYLHHFPNPHIYEYDTLTSDDRWNDDFDVILANPPFMTPKGGIRPHNRFSVPSNRAEVLFVDYILEHLTPNGKAGVIVPEGIIFTNQIAYKALRKMMVDDEFLWAVISLPPGVFQPYSGVKTCILLFDRQLARQTDNILFINVRNDGYGLGAQRRQIDKNDLPAATELLKQYKQNFISNSNVLNNDSLPEHLIISKSSITEGGEYNLSMERYTTSSHGPTGTFPLVSIDELCQIQRGISYSSSDIGADGVPMYNLRSVKKNGSTNNDDFKFYKGEIQERHLVQFGDLLVALTDLTPNSDIIGSPKYVTFQDSVVRACYSADLAKLVTDKQRVQNKYLSYILSSKNYRSYIVKFSNGANVKHLRTDGLKQFKIPLPSLPIQQQIAEQLDRYQKIIEGAKLVEASYLPIIEIDKSWETVKIGKICDLVRGSSPRPQGDPRYYGGTIPRLMVSDLTRDGMYVTPRKDFLTEEGAKLSRPMKKGDVVMAVSGNPGLPAILAMDAVIHDGFVGFRNLDKGVIPEFLYYMLLIGKQSNSAMSVGAVFKNLTTDQVKNIDIPLPSLDIQRTVVAVLEEERQQLQAVRELMRKAERKMNLITEALWGEK